MAARHQVTPDDVMDMAAYAAVRKEKRAAIAALKRDRRLSVGPFATFYFESYETMWMQIHEMLYIERGGDAQIPGELEAYNPLIPQGKELVATLMFEIEDPDHRARVLYRIAGVEATIRLELDGREIAAVPVEEPTERTSPDGKTSSVHFVRFPFSDADIALFEAQSTRPVLGFTHEHYAHMAVMPDAVRAALAADFA